jgi:rhodanese-related sulfurtransferase
MAKKSKAGTRAVPAPRRRSTQAKAASGKTSARAAPVKSASTSLAQRWKASLRMGRAGLIGGGLVLLLTLVVAGIWFGPGRKNLAATPVALADEISVTEAHQKFEQGAYMLDVRTPEEWQEYHVAGSTQIPLEQLASRVDELPKDQEIVVVCRSGNRSQQGRDILRQAGISQSTSMQGGLVAWRSAGYPLVENQP